MLGRSLRRAVIANLPEFDPSLYVGVRNLNETAECHGVRSRTWPELYVTHELAVPLQQTCRVRERRALKESHVHVRSENIDVAEGRVSETCNWAAIMEELADFVAAFSHHVKPFMRDVSQFTGMVFHPCVDGRIAFDGAVESKYVRSHRRCPWAESTTRQSFPRG